MQLHQLKPIHKNKPRKRVGRGGKRGAYSGRGMKGQKQHAGRKIPGGWKELIKRLPKQRGTKFKSFREKPQIVNLGEIEKNFKDSEIVSPPALLERGLIEKKKNRMPQVKILSQGEITKKIIVKNCLVSQSAREKIEKIGGEIK